MDDLYLDQPTEFEKEAGYAARLSEEAENWPQEINSELMKQLPYLSDYDVNVNLDRVETNRGFAFGYADVANRTERPEIEHDEAGLPHIRVPLIVSDRALKPFATFLDGDKVMPMNEDRVREVLFNPATFDISAGPPRDPSLVEPLMPPQRSGIGMGGEYKMAAAAANDLLVELEGKFKTAAAAVDNHRSVVVMKGAKADIDFGNGHVVKKGENLKLHPYSHEHGGVPVELPDGRFIIIGHKEKKSSIPLLTAIAPTLDEGDIQRMVSKIASDPNIQAGLMKCGAAERLVDALKVERVSASERLGALADDIEPTTITFQKLPGGDFLVKQAHVDYFNEKTAAGEVMPGAQAAEAMGPEQAQAMQPGQTATATAEPVPEEALEPKEDAAEVVDAFGQYMVHDELGNSLVGHVFPTTLSWDGSFSEQPIALFTNGSSYAMQDTIAGELVGKGTTLPDDEPRGDGAFYAVDGGEAVATAPITIGSVVAGPDGLPRMQGSDSFGNQVQLSQVEGLDAPMRVSDLEMAIPKSWKFMRLNNQTQLQGGGMSNAGGAMPGAEDEMGMGEDVGGMSDAPKKPSSKKPSEKKPEKKESKPEGKPESKGTKVEVNVGEKAKKEKSSAVLFYNGSYNFKGGCGLEKISRNLTQDLDPVSAEFMLGVLGVDGATAKMKVSEARKKGMVKLSNLKTITTLGEQFSQATKVASALAEEMPDLKRDLIKEAAEIADEGTVDNLLALNFINPENLATFVGYMPKLEETSERLAEMLLYSQLGMNELPESAVERSMKNMEEVVQGLKGIAQT